MGPLRGGRPAADGVRQQGGQAARRLPSALDQLRSMFGSGFVPLELPLGEEEALHGIADVLTEQALRVRARRAAPHRAASRRRRRRGAPAARRARRGDRLRRRRAARALPLRRRADGGRAGAHAGPRAARLQLEFPVLCGSALTGVGVDRLADFICELGPSPADRPTTVAAGNGDGSVTVDVGADPSGKPLAYVFKTVADQFVGQVSLFKVLSGTVVVDERLSARATSAPRSACTACSTCAARTTSPPTGSSPATSGPSPSWPTPTPARRWRRRTRRCASPRPSRRRPSSGWP